MNWFSSLEILQERDVHEDQLKYIKLEEKQDFKYHETFYG